MKADKTLEERFGITKEVKEAWAGHVRKSFREYYDETLTKDEVLNSEAFKKVVAERSLEGIKFIAKRNECTCEWIIEWPSVKESPSACSEEHGFARLIKSGEIVFTAGVYGRKLDK
jgi:hypothetical protein